MKIRWTLTAIAACLMGLAAACGGIDLDGEGLNGATPTETDDVLVSVDVSARTQPISPLIYGISASGGAKPYFKNMGISVVRWGRQRPNPLQLGDQRL